MNLLQIVREKYQILAHKHVYHGSPHKFDRFSKISHGKNYGAGIYFTEDEDEARQYGYMEIDDNAARDHTLGKGYLYTVDLNVSKPFDVRNKAQAKKISDHLELDWSTVLKNQLWKDSSCGFDVSDKDNLYLKIFDTLSDRLKSQGRRWYEADSIFIKAMKELGFDCIHDTKKKWWVVYEPSKIKILSVKKITGRYCSDTGKWLGNDTKTK